MQGPSALNSDCEGSADSREETGVDQTGRGTEEERYEAGRGREEKPVWE